MKTVMALTGRNIKLFFKDKGMFFTALITPMILLALYVAFLGNVYRESFVLNLPQLQLPDELLDGLVAGQLTSSILAVSCVTVAFCANFLMVQDKANGSRKDLTISPVKPAALSVSYYLATLLCTGLLCLTAAAMCMGYMAAVGWYMSAADGICLLVDVLLLTLFGTALSSVINFFLSTQGQISAVGTIVSSGYGFLCGAYMPISSFSKELQRLLSFLPGTYATALLRNHAMQGALREMEALGVPEEAIRSLRDAMDCNLYFFETQVSIPAMYILLIATVAALIGLYLLMNALQLTRSTKPTCV